MHGLRPCTGTCCPADRPADGAFRHHLRRHPHKDHRRHQRKGTKGIPRREMGRSLHLAHRHDPLSKKRHQEKHPHRGPVAPPRRWRQARHGATLLPHRRHRDGTVDQGGGQGAAFLRLHLGEHPAAPQRRGCRTSGQHPRQSPSCRCPQARTCGAGGARHRKSRHRPLQSTRLRAARIRL